MKCEGFKLLAILTRIFEISFPSRIFFWGGGLRFVPSFHFYVHLTAAVDSRLSYCNPSQTFSPCYATFSPVL